MSYLNFNLSRSAHDFKTLTNSDGLVVGLEVRRGHQSVYYHRTSRGVNDFVDPRKGELRSFFRSELHLIEQFKNKFVLDIGCGDGTFASHLNAKAIAVFGLDLYLNEMQRGTDFFVEGDAFSIPVHSGAFEVLVSSYSVFHYEPLHQLGHLLREAHRVLSRNGLFYLTAIDEPLRVAELQRLSSRLKMAMQIDAVTHEICLIKS